MFIVVQEHVNAREKLTALDNYPNKIMLIFLDTGRTRFGHRKWSSDEVRVHTLTPSVWEISRWVVENWGNCRRITRLRCD